MATSFAAYASQFLNKQQNAHSSQSSSQPMFFSFTTDDGSRAGHISDSDLDDVDDPHLRASDASRVSRRTYAGDADDGTDPGDDDPYLRLDEDAAIASRHPQRQVEDIPLIASEGPPSSAGGSPKGWLAHQTSPMRSPSPSRSSSDSSPPPDIFSDRRQPPPPPTSRAPISLSLTESLLPRDGHTRPLDVFSLPDPRHTPRGRRKYNDSVWTAIWLSGVTICLFFSILTLFITHKPSKPSRVTLPYTTLLHTVPMLTILTFVSAFVAYAHIFLLQIFVKPVMIATSVFIPATLFISAIWAFVGSFMWDADLEPTWGETVGLRLFSIVPLVLSLLTARRLTNLPREIHTTSSTLTLTTKLLLANPFLLALSPTILLAALVLSIPFLTLIFRLLLIGYVSRPDANTPEWHVKGWANWAIAGTVIVWLWSWGVARGILQMSCAGVIGSWYFADPDELPPPPPSTHTIHAALTRSTSPSLGTIVLSALILTGIRVLGLVTLSLRRLPLYLPIYLRPLATGSMMAVGILDGVTTALSKYALVYTGLTGDPFMPSARRVRALTASVEAKDAARYKRKFKTEPPLTLLTIAPLTLTFPFALTTYLFVAHTLNAPNQALGAALLAGGVTALVGLFCVGLVRDTADTLYVCYCIDKDIGARRREEVFAAFEYENRPPQQPVDSPSHINRQHPHPAPRQQQQPQPQRAREPLPYSPSPPPHSRISQPQPQHPHRFEPTPPPPPQEDIDPFERPGSYLEDDSRLQPHRMKPNTTQLDKKPATKTQDADSDEDEDGDGSQFFPGSGFF